MVGLTGIIFVFLPESPWWLAGKDKLDEAAKVLQMCNGSVEGYDVQEQIVSSPFQHLLCHLYGAFWRNPAD